VAGVYGLVAGIVKRRGSVSPEPGGQPVLQLWPGILLARG
jgi:hypothetical protein